MAISSLPVIAPGYTPAPLMSILTRLRLTAGLQFCLDAADRASWPGGASTKWLDRSGNGQDFFLGSDGATAANMPTFNGTVGGLSGNEFWSFDGGDFFRYDSANETWMTTLSQTGASVAFIWGVWCISAPQRTIGTHGGSTNGAVFGVSAANQAAELFVRVGGVGSTAIQQSQRIVNTGGWTIAAIVFREGAAGGSFTMVNGAVGGPLTASVTANTNAPSFTMEIAAGGNRFGPFPNGSRLSFIAAWSGATLPSQQDMLAIYNEIKGRLALN